MPAGAATGAQAGEQYTAACRADAAACTCTVSESPDPLTQQEDPFAPTRRLCRLRVGGATIAAVSPGAARTRRIVPAMREGFDACARLAARQHGVVSRAQLRALDWSSSAIGRLVGTRWLHRVHLGVYSVGPPRETWPARLWAALLACGGPEAAVFSHPTAGALWHVCPAPRRIHLITLGERRSTPAIYVHRGRLEPHEITSDRDHGLPVTRPMTTLLHLATTLNDFRFGRAVHRAAELRLLDASLVPPGRPGAARLRAQVSALATEPPRVTKPGFEERFLRFIHDHGLPMPLTNVIVNGHDVDAYWPQARLIVEHVLAGDRVIRLTWSRLTQRTAQRLHRLLA